MLYHAYQLQYRLARADAGRGRNGSFAAEQPAADAAAPRRLHAQLAAAWEVFSRLRLTHQRPSFGIDSVQVGEREVPVREVAVQRRAFCTLQRFVRDDLGDAPTPSRPRC